MLHHGACYYPELWPEADLERDIAGIKAAGLTFVRMGDFSWSHLEPEEGKISLAFFLKVMDRLHAEGIRVVFCTSTPSAARWAATPRSSAGRSTTSSSATSARISTRPPSPTGTAGWRNATTP